MPNNDPVVNEKNDKIKETNVTQDTSAAASLIPTTVAPIPITDATFKVSAAVHETFVNTVVTERVETMFNEINYGQTHWILNGMTMLARLVSNFIINQIPPGNAFGAASRNVFVSFGGQNATLDLRNIQTPIYTMDTPNYHGTTAEIRLEVDVFCVLTNIKRQTHLHVCFIVDQHDAYFTVNNQQIPGAVIGPNANDFIFFAALYALKVNKVYLNTLRDMTKDIQRTTFANFWDTYAEKVREVFLNVHTQVQRLISCAVYFTRYCFASLTNERQMFVDINLQNKDDDKLADLISCTTLPRWFLFHLHYSNWPNAGLQIENTALHIGKDFVAEMIRCIPFVKKYSDITNLQQNTRFFFERSFLKDSAVVVHPRLAVRTMNGPFPHTTRCSYVSSPGIENFLKLAAEISTFFIAFCINRFALQNIQRVFGVIQVNYQDDVQDEGYILESVMNLQTERFMFRILGRYSVLNNDNIQVNNETGAFLAAIVDSSLNEIIDTQIPKPLKSKTLIYQRNDTENVKILDRTSTVIADDYIYILRDIDLGNEQIYEGQRYFNLLNTGHPEGNDYAFLGYGLDIEVFLRMFVTLVANETIRPNDLIDFVLTFYDKIRNHQSWVTFRHILGAPNVTPNTEAEWQVYMTVALNFFGYCLAQYSAQNLLPETYYLYNYFQTHEDYLRALANRAYSNYNLASKKNFTGMHAE